MQTDTDQTLTDASAPSPHIAAAVARAERRRAMLEELAALGMTLARGITPTTDSGPEARFAEVSRAIRHTLAQAGRLDDHILALRNRTSEAPPASAPAPEAAAAPSDDRGVEPGASPSPRRARIGAEVRAAAEHSFEEPRAVAEAHARLTERLFESDVYDRLLALPLREAVEAVCADLGLAPDWAAWSDETGFARDPAHARLQPGHGQVLRQAAENDLIRRLSLSPSRGAGG